MNQIKAGAILNYVTIGINTLLGLLYTPYMLRMLGQNEFGLYSLVASIIAYLTILDFGFGNAITRYTAKFRAENKLDEQWQMFGMFLWIYTLIGFFSSLIGVGLYFNVDLLFDRTMTPEELSQAKTMMILLVVNLALTFPLSVFGSIITAYEDFIFQKTVNIIRLLLCTATIILLLYFGYKAVAMVVVQTVFNLATLVINFFYCKYRIKIKIHFKKINKAFFKEISIYSFWIFINSIMDRIYWSTGQFVLGVTCGTVAVAIYSVAILLQQLYMSFSTAICSVLLPRITALVSNGASDKEISDLFIRTGRVQYIIMSLILSGFIVFGQSFIFLWAGEGYDDSFPITLIFFLTLLTPLIQNVGITILQARNQMKFRSLLYIAISVVSLIFQIILSKRYGGIGCAIAVGGAILLGQGLIMNIYYSRKQHLDIGHFWKEIIRMSLAPIFTIIVAIPIVHHLSLISWTSLIVAVGIYTTIYCALFYKFSTNAYERKIISTPFRLIAQRFKKTPS